MGTTRHIRSRLRTGAVLTVVGLLTACGGDDTTGDANAADTAADSAPAGGSAPGASTAADEAEFDRTAEFVWAARTMPRSLNPHLTPFTGGSVPGLTMLHDRLTYMNPQTGSIEPMLAAEWSANEQGTQIDFVLREGATYHNDGSPVDAASVVANFEYGKQLGDAHPESAGYALIESAETIDERTVRYHLAGNYAGAIPELMSGGLGMPVNPNSFDREDDAEYDAGTGPYVVEDIRPGQTITMVPYEDYYDPAAQTIGRLVVTLIEEEDTLINGIATGEIDAGSMSGASIARAESAGLTVASNVGNTAWAMFINTERTEMQDPRVRRALNMAVDREAIANGPLQGQCIPTVQPWNEQHPGHNPDYPADYYPHDPERARELLAEAGFPDGLSFEIDTYTIPSYVPVAEVLQSQLAQGGFDVTIRQLDTAQLSPGFRTEKTLDTWFTRTPFGQPPTRSITNYWSPDGDNNPGGLDNPDLVATYEKLLAETDVDRQAELLQEATAQIVEQPSAVLILCHDRSFTVGGEDAIGIDPEVIGFMDFRNMGKRAG